MNGSNVVGGVVWEARGLSLRGTWPWPNEGGVSEAEKNREGRKGRARDRQRRKGDWVYEMLDSMQMDLQHLQGVQGGRCRT